MPLLYWCEPLPLSRFPMARRHRCSLACSCSLFFSSKACLRLRFFPHPRATASCVPAAWQARGERVPIAGAALTKTRLLCAAHTSSWLAAVDAREVSAVFPLQHAAPPPVWSESQPLLCFYASLSAMAAPPRRPLHGGPQPLLRDPRVAAPRSLRLLALAALVLGQHGLLHQLEVASEGSHDLVHLAELCGRLLCVVLC